MGRHGPPRLESKKGPAPPAAVRPETADQSALSAAHPPHCTHPHPQGRAITRWASTSRRWKTTSARWRRKARSRPTPRPTSSRCGWGQAQGRGAARRGARGTCRGARGTAIACAWNQPCCPALHRPPTRPHAARSLCAWPFIKRRWRCGRARAWTAPCARSASTPTFTQSSRHGWRWCCCWRCVERGTRLALLALLRRARRPETLLCRADLAAPARAWSPKQCRVPPSPRLPEQELWCKKGPPSAEFVGMYRAIMQVGKVDE